jgi:hypothetical protein
VTRRRPPQAHRPGLRAGLALLTLALLPIACARTSTITVSSVAGEGVMAVEAPIVVYTTPDENAAEIYLTTLPEKALLTPGGLQGERGVIIAINQFFTPLATRTPIEDTASNASVRHIIVAGDEVGVYGGGGFLFPGKAPGDPTYTASLESASLRLLRATPGFLDRLGASELSGDIAARRDPEQARRLAAIVRRLLARTDLREISPEPTGADSDEDRDTLNGS